MIQCTILTLFIPCILIELNCSFTTPTNALVYIQLQSDIAPTCFGVIYVILIELYTKT